MWSPDPLNTAHDVCTEWPLRADPGYCTERNPTTDSEHIMAEGTHPAAPHHLPGFLPGPDGSDPLFTGTVIGVIVLILILGNLYFRLHALPERMAHRANNTQLQLVAVLALIALFTHNNIFWVAALILAIVQLPDFTTPLNLAAQSLERLAGRADQIVDDLDPPPAKAETAPTTSAPAPTVDEVRDRA